jgi:hypothetical protein
VWPIGGTVLYVRLQGDCPGFQMSEIILHYVGTGKRITFTEQPMTDDVHIVDCARDNYVSRKQ